MTDDASCAWKARYIFPVSGPPLANAVLRIRGAIIEAVSDARAAHDAVDLGNVAIVPSLVNAHTHLEFSGCAEPLGTPGLSLPAWIGQVVAARRSTVAAGGALSPIEGGLSESLAAGTTTLGEIATTDWRAGAPSVPRTVMFHESIAPVVERIAPALAAAEQFLAQRDVDSPVLPALSPHAPYTVHPRLLAGLVELSRQYNVPVAMHLAESGEELELLEHGSGPFAQLLQDVGAWDGAADARLASPLEYLEVLAGARALVIHGNYLDQAAWQFLAAHARTMSVVYCARTHAYFRHAAYPLSQMLAAGVAVALGTDSRASNPDLSLWAEMRHLARHHPRVPPATVLELGTLAGARALGLDDRIGTLDVGKQADFVVVSLPERSAADPHALLLDDDARVEQTWFAGQRVSP